ncbi:hypothetical protein MAR_020711, partial [Mya arenaria]
KRPSGGDCTKPCGTRTGYERIKKSCRPVNLPTTTQNVTWYRSLGIKTDKITDMIKDRERIVESTAHKTVDSQEAN